MPRAKKYRGMFEKLAIAALDKTIQASGNRKNLLTFLEQMNNNYGYSLVQIS